MKHQLPRCGSLCMALAATLLLASCGGSGGGGDSMGGGGGGGGGGAGTSMSAAELQRAMNMLTLHNNYRAGLVPSLPPLVWYAPAADVAFAHSVRQADEGMIFHVDPVTMKNSCDRTADAGITNNPSGGAVCTFGGPPFVGENVAWGFNTTDQGIMNGWVGSNGHLRQIVAPNVVDGSASPPWTHCTIGVRDAGGGNVYWTAMFFQNPTP